MNQVSLLEIVTLALEEIKGFVLKILKEMVEAMLLEEQDKVLGRGRYERRGSKAWRFMSRFPGFQDEEHSSNVLGIYLLGVERYRKTKEVLPYAL